VGYDYIITLIDVFFQGDSDKSLIFGLLKIFPARRKKREHPDLSKNGVLATGGSPAV
jgi:hypothetical protein